MPEKQKFLNVNYIDDNNAMQNKYTETIIEVVEQSVSKCLIGAYLH